MSQVEKIKASQLQAGDILLLEPDDDWISKLIVKVTKSPVSHTVMSCGQAATVGTVIEETPPSAVKGTVLNRTARTAYVMRLQSYIKDFQPVMDIAAKYVSEELPYAYAQLPFIGLYCIVYDLSEGKKLQGLITRLMRIALGIIVEMEDKLFYDGNEAMMCSQFAYHCYRETGSDYEIHMKDNKIGNLIDKIIDIISKNPKKYNDQVFTERMSDTLITDEEVNEVLSGLYQELDNNSDGTLLQDSNMLGDDFIVAVCQFCVKFVKSFSKEDNYSEEQDIQYYLEKLKEMKEYFIAPGDLLSNTTNLLCLGTVDYEGYHVY
jgi:hypothetical protein